MLKRFRKGGVHPADHKLSKEAVIERAVLPETVVIPLSQHIGVPAEPLVKKGDRVKAGDPIGRAAGFISAAVHASVSGVVKSVDEVTDADGRPRKAITITVEGDEWNESIDRSDTLAEECFLAPKTIISKIADAGIVGMGGAAFPTHVKLTVPEGKRATALVINGAECEPYLTADHRLMLERGAEIVAGIGILCRALEAERAYIGIENNKPDAIARMRELTAGKPHIRVVPLRTRYPQGGEKQLIDAVLGQQVPPGALPIETGAVVQNVGTALAVYEAVQKNKPLLERVVTVTGKGLRTPKNLLVRIGTPVTALLEQCGGIPEGTTKIIAGGPMMGRAIANPEGAVIQKGSSGIVVMEGGEGFRKEPSACIRCAKCVDACPMGLEPYLLSRLSLRHLFAEAEALHPTDCIECGSCSYTCPAAIPLLDNIRVAKSEVMKRIRSRK